MRITALLLVGIIILVVTSTHGAGQAKKAESNAARQTASASERFGFNLFSGLNQNRPGGNVFISPSSISWCLSMVLNGAQGQTKDEIAKALQVEGISTSDLNQVYRDWKNSWVSIDPKVEIDVANSIWASQGSGVRPEFIQTNKTFYSAEVQELDFSDPRSLFAINSWVKNKTRGKIDKIIDQISPDSMLFLINAVYFNGKWMKAFDPAQTKEDSFTTAGGQQKKLPMMRQRGTFSYQEDSAFQSVRLPYGNGRLNMYIFLPTTSTGMKKFQGMLTSANWQRWMTQFQESEGQIVLPRFRVEYEAELNQPLKALGMKSAFDPQSADFRAMIQSSRGAFISNVKHKAFAEVSEEGTEAAAVTSTEVRVVSMPLPTKTFTMIVNRPFFFAIRDDATGLLLFLGSIQNP